MLYNKILIATLTFREVNLFYRRLPFEARQQIPQPLLPEIIRFVFFLLSDDEAK
jgi:hypothetical protein